MEDAVNMLFAFLKDKHTFEPKLLVVISVPSEDKMLYLKSLPNHYL
jgi:hypothetical protein